MYINFIIKYALLVVILINSYISLIVKTQSNGENDYSFNNYRYYSIASLARNITNIAEVYLTISDINYIYSKEYNLIEVTYYINLFDLKFHHINPSNLHLLFNLRILCNLYIFEQNENIYSFAHIYENRCYYCIEYIKLSEQAKFGIVFYKINEINGNVEYNELFFFNEKLININLNISHQNNNRFNPNNVFQNYQQFLQIINKSKKEINSEFYLKSSYLKFPLCLLKRDNSLVEGRWYFNNIYETYFCYCKGKSCINLSTFYMYNFQQCKYSFYLTVIDDNKYLYQKTHYLFSDFFDENIEPSESLPIFMEMLKLNLDAHYMTLSSKIFDRFCKKNKCFYNFRIIYGIRKITGDFLEKYLELILKLKVVVTAEMYDSLDNLFYNIEYITYLFLGHGVTYIKSYLYNDYLSPKRYNKILLPPSERFITLALQYGWKNEDIVKIGYPKWDNYKIHNSKNLFNYDSIKKEKSIFMMFTWRKTKKKKNLSDLYYNNINNILNNPEINEQLSINNIRLYFCYHHTIREKRKIELTDNDNIRFISQKEISRLLKNSSLIITDFSSIIFDAMVQRKPLILFIPDGLDSNLQDIYTQEYYETITKIKDGIIYLYEVFLDLNLVIEKIIYYIKNNFALENEKLKFYKKFSLKRKGNTKRFINYIKNYI